MQQEFIFRHYYTLDKKRMSKIKPSKEKLLNLSREEISENFEVSDKTVVRWLKSYDMFERKGRKLNQTKASEIRFKYTRGKSMKDLSLEYKVTFAAISRVINNITYKTTEKTYAGVSVIYNPD